MIRRKVRRHERAVVLQQKAAESENIDRTEFNKKRAEEIRNAALRKVRPTR